MAIKFYKAVTDDGGTMGEQIASGEKGALFPLVTSSDRHDGIITHRKFYIESDSSIGIDVGIDGGSIFPVCIFESSGDAEVVGDLTGSERKYGVGKIVKAIDSSDNSETVNGSGGLSDIKKVVIEDDTVGDTYFIVNDKANIDDNTVVISAVNTVTEGIELTFSTALQYYGVIDNYIYSLVSTTIAQDGHVSFWIKETVLAGTVTEIGYNTFPIMTVY